ncbi:5-formyltetrahydrofolate cyclo-ligase [Hymenobacter gummosus]|uniref:5-formyltetrahydrofolate cyclo-ligase n=1 Tax=Hymenobacter gummosus TaxID=1776032 RepID=A0A3S0H729_9BACT|nr:5-formyltetrahydrofolate cyclo-ligase [Hymenobacter gummosus]RTQ47108.1 5-formyltetrahydrofolate cyclo-ligase [Hymenobacter gummosus]
MSTKAELRRQMLAARKQLLPAEVQRRSAALAAQFFAAFPVAEWSWLHTFLPIPQQHEPDTWLIIRRVWQQLPGLRVAVPVVQADGVSLQHYHLDEATELTPNRWGIPEPAGQALPPGTWQPDAVLIPLLAFDEQGQRVGYGKGFYDRFLAQHPQALRIGLSLEPPVPRIADVWPGDVPLHACVTPGRVWRFGLPAAGGQ